MAVRFVIFSDLDATLLDHKTYSFKPAIPVLKKLKKMNIPVVLCTSKTRAETEAIARDLGLNHPFIVENGGAIFIPEGYFASRLFKKAGISALKKGKYRLIQLGTPYPRLREIFKKISETAGIRMLGFGDLKPEEIAAVTGLKKSEAERAARREYDEPFVVEGSQEFELLEKKIKSRRTKIDKKEILPPAALKELQRRASRPTEAAERRSSGPSQSRILARIKQMAGRYRLRVTAGGRFYHLTGNNDKGRAVRLLKKLYRLESGKIITIGLGDSINDLPMLRAVDLPVLVARPEGQSFKIHDGTKNLLRTTCPGPEGWAQAVSFLLGLLNSGPGKRKRPCPEKGGDHG